MAPPTRPAPAGLAQPSLIDRAAEALGAGRLDEAESCCRQAITAGQSAAVARQVLGLVMHRRGDFGQAIKNLQESITLAPGRAAWHFNLGVSYRAAGRLEEARDAYLRATELDPGYAPAHLNLGSVRLALGDAPGALASFKSTLKLQPDHGNACFQAGALYRDMGDIGRALKMLRRAAQRLPGDAEVSLALGVVLLDSGELDEAEALLAHLSHDQPEMLEAATALAGVYERQGRHDRAWELIEPLLNHERVRVDAALVLAGFASKVDRVALAIRKLNEAMENVSVCGDQPMLCHFALGRLHDAQGEFDRAFDHYHRANGLKARQFDPDEHARHVDALMRAFSTETLANHARATHGDRRPIFIVGMPRSGTSLVEQVLATHPDVIGGGELPFISSLAGQLLRLASGGVDQHHYPKAVTQAQLNEMARVYLAQLDKLSTDAARITDKTPSNFLYLGLIALMLPEARIVHCRRDPMAACWSCFTTNFVGEHAYSYSLEHLGAYYRQYERLMRHWRGVLGVPVLDVDYERMVSEPESAMRELVAFCGLDWDDACLRFHENPRPMPSASYDQVRRPIYRNSVDHWRRYEKHLGPLREALDRPAA